MSRVVWDESQKDQETVTRSLTHAAPCKTGKVRRDVITAAKYSLGRSLCQGKDAATPKAPGGYSFEAGWSGCWEGVLGGAPGMAGIRDGSRAESLARPYA